MLERPLDMAEWIARTVPGHGLSIPDEIQATLDQLDAFIEAEILPLQLADDNMRFFDHRREHARTDWDNDGVPRDEWEELLREMRRRADAAGWLRLALPEEFGGRAASNLEMAIIREHLAHRGLGLHNDLQNENSIVGNFPTVLMMRDFGTAPRNSIAKWIPDMLDGGAPHRRSGSPSHNHGSDATWTWRPPPCATATSGSSTARSTGTRACTTPRTTIIFARTSGEDPGEPGHGITCIHRPRWTTPGFQSSRSSWWTFNMPTDHAHVRLTDVRVHNDDGPRP